MLPRLITIAVLAALALPALGQQPGATSSAKSLFESCPRGWVRTVETRDRFGTVLVRSMQFQRHGGGLAHRPAWAAAPAQQDQDSIRRAWELAGRVGMVQATPTALPPSTVTAPAVTVVPAPTEAAFQQHAQQFILPQASHAVVYIQLLTEGGPPGMYQVRSGSGFVLQDGSLVTAWHVLLDSEGQFYPTTLNGRPVRSNTLVLRFAWQPEQPEVRVPLRTVEFVQANQKDDLVILRPTRQDLRRYTFGLRVAQTGPRLGTPVFRLGLADGDAHWAGGVVEDTYRTTNGGSRLRTNQAPRKGDSGAPVLNWAGEVCGVHVEEWHDGSGREGSGIVPLHAN